MPIFNPEPQSIVAGRRFLYDASLTSSHGDSACASCHVFGDFDSLAWDLGDPDGTTLNNPNPDGPFFGTVGLLGFAFRQPIAANGFAPGPEGEAQAEKAAKFLLAFDSNMAPIVGQQITPSNDNGAVAGPRVSLLIARAAAGECDLVVKGGVNERGYLYDGSGLFLRDRTGVPPLTDAALRQLASYPRGELTYTCVPPGSGRRIGIDADLDGYLDGDERNADSDPRDPASTP